MAEEGKKSGLVDSEEEEPKGNWAVSVDLPEVPVVTGEEDEDTIFKTKCKLYRIHDGQWKERGQGDMKLLRHKTHKKIRLIMRQEKTHKIVANHYISETPFCDLAPMASNDKAFLWLANDFAEDKSSHEKLAARFNTVEIATNFKNAFNDAKEFNIFLKEGKTEELKYADVIVEAKEEKKEEEKKKEEDSKEKEEKAEEKTEEKAEEKTE